MYLAARDRYRSLAKSASIAAFVICLLLMGWFTWVGAQLGAYHVAQHEIWNNVPVKILHQGGNLNASDGTGFYYSEISFTDPSGKPRLVWTTLPRDSTGFGNQDAQTSNQGAQSCYNDSTGNVVCNSSPAPDSSGYTVCAGSSGNWFNTSDMGHYEASQSAQSAFGDSSQPSCPPPLPPKLIWPTFTSLYQSLGLSAIVAILVYWLLPFVAAFKYRHRKGVSAQTRMYERQLDQLRAAPQTKSTPRAIAVVSQLLEESLDEDNTPVHTILAAATDTQQYTRQRNRERKKRGVV